LRIGAETVRGLGEARFDCGLERIAGREDRHQRPGDRSDSNQCEQQKEDAAKTWGAVGARGHLGGRGGEGVSELRRAARQTVPHLPTASPQTLCRRARGRGHMAQPGARAARPPTQRGVRPRGVVGRLCGRRRGDVPLATVDSSHLRVLRPGRPTDWAHTLAKVASRWGRRRV